MKTKYTNPKFAPRKGYPNEQVATVSDWINNDPNLYFRAIDLLQLYEPYTASKILSVELANVRTPCGENFGKAALRYVLTEISGEVNA